MKRKAEYDLDRKELEANDFDLPTTQQNQTNNISTRTQSDEISRRKIVKIKLPSAVLAEKEQAKVSGKFILEGDLDSNKANNTNLIQEKSSFGFLNPQKNEEKVKGTFSDSPILDNKDKFIAESPSEEKNQAILKDQTKTISTNSDQKAPPISFLGAAVSQEKKNMNQPSLFNLPSVFGSNQTSSLLFPLNASNQSTSLFGQSKPISSLFPQGDKDATPPSSIPITSGPKNLFESLMPQTKTDNKKPEEKNGSQKEQVKPIEKTSLFGALRTGPASFSGSSINLGTSSLLFGLNKEQENGKGGDFKEGKSDNEPRKGSLLSNFLTNNLSANSQPFSLFSKIQEDQPQFKDFISQKPQGFQSTFSAARNDEEEDNIEEGEDDNEPQRSPSPEIDISKSEKNVQFDDPFEKIISKDVEKFRCNDNPILGRGTISLNKTKDANAYFIIFRNPAKLVLYQGQLIKNLSKVSNLGNKQDVLQLRVFSTKNKEKSKVGENDKEEEKKEESKSKYSADLVKLMFATNDACSEFKNEVEKFI